LLKLEPLSASPMYIYIHIYIYYILPRLQTTETFDLDQVTNHHQL